MEVNLTITDTQFHEADSRGDLNYLTVNPKEEQVVTTEGKTSKLVCKIAGYPTVNHRTKWTLQLINFRHQYILSTLMEQNSLLGNMDGTMSMKMEEWRSKKSHFEIRVGGIVLLKPIISTKLPPFTFQSFEGDIFLTELEQIKPFSFRRPSLVRKTPVREGETSRIFCHSSEESSKIDLGRPEGVTFWDLPRKNNLDRWNHSVDRYFYNTTDSTLTIVGVKRKDRGLYR